MVGGMRIIIAPISVAIEAIVIRSSRERLSTTSPYNSTEYPSNLLAPKILRRFKITSFAATFSGFVPVRLILTESGTLNHTEPFAQAAAIS